MKRDYTPQEAVKLAGKIPEVITVSIHYDARRKYMMRVAIGVEGRGVVHCKYKGRTLRACIAKLRKEIDE